MRNCSGDPFSCDAEEEEEALRVALGSGGFLVKRRFRFEEGKKGLVEVEGESERNEDEEETIEIEVNTIFVLLQCSLQALTHI